MEQPAMLVLAVASVSQATLTAHLLLLRSAQRQVYLPMAIFLVAISLLFSWPIFTTLFPQFLSVVVAFSLPALLLLGPCLWLYVDGLTSESSWTIRKEHWRHFVLFACGLLVTLIAMSLPYEVRETLLVTGEEVAAEDITAIGQYVVAVAALMAFVLILLWVVQSTFYAAKISRHLTRYRIRLKDLFASTVSRELKWLSWLLIAVGAVWLLVALTLVSDHLFNASVVNTSITRTAAFIMIWSLSVWTLRQKPGFEELYLAEAQASQHLQREVTPPAVDLKYERSALSQAQAAQIADKIRGSMENDKLYLDSALSLQKLSKFISVSPNYISQTLNETL